MDTETKRRIDTARDILVGKVPDPKSQVEQITLALIYKFMDDMDAEAEELGGKRTFFSGDFERYGWAKLMDVSLGAQETLNRYAEAIEKMKENQNVPQLFREIFKNAFLPYRDPETLKAFLKIIDDFEYDHSERLGDAYEYLLSVMSSQGDAGQFRTPRHIIDFMVKLVEPKKEEKVLDPACGTAGFLISAFKYIKDENRKAEKEGKGMTPDEHARLMSNFEGYDISPDMVRLSLVNLYLHGFQTPKIYEYDTLTSEDRWNDFADVILANPPFMSPKGGIRPHKRFSVESNRSEVLFVDYIMEHLTPNGRAAVIVPEGVIFQGGSAYKALRKMLVEQDYLVGVISLPAGVFNPYSGVKTSILWVDRALAKKALNIIFCKIEGDGFDLGAQRRQNGINDLPDAVHELMEFKKITNESQSYSTDGLNKAYLVDKNRLSKDGEYNLSFERYNIPRKHSETYELKMIKELAEFSSGLWIGKKEPFVRIKVIRNTNFRKDGFIDWTNIAEIEAEIKQFKTRELRYGDIILEKSGGGPTQPVGRVAFFDSHDNGYSFSNFTSLIRTTSAQILPKYLWLILWYLHTKGVTEKFQQQTSGIRNLELKRYQEIQLPIPTLDNQSEIVAEIESYQKIIDGARMVVENYRPQIDVDPTWPVVKLGEVCEVKGGKRLPKGKTFEESTTEHPYLRVTDFQEMSINESTVKYISKKIHGEIGNYLISSENVYISIAGTIGLFGTIPEKFNGANLTENAAKIILSKKIIDKDFLVFLGNSEEVQAQIKRLTYAVGVPKLALERIKLIEIPLPPLEIQKTIVQAITEEMKLIRAAKELISLYNGKIRARVEKIWGE